MGGIASPGISGEVGQKRRQLSVAVAWGALMGVLTFAVGPISSISSKVAIGAIQKGLMILIIPGLIGGAASVETFTLFLFCQQHH